MPNGTPRAWIVVPCYNEAERLPAAAFEAFAAAHEGIGFCFVNDGSVDGTGSMLRGLAERGGERMAALDMAANAGKAEAVRAGVLHLLERVGDGDFIGYWDADLATPLEEIARFLEIVEDRPGIDFVMGSRVRRLGARVERRLLRHYMGRVFATCASAILGLPVYDTQCGAKLIRARLAREIFAEPFLSRWFFDIELLARTILKRGRAGTMEAIVEAPLEKWMEVGESRVRPIHILRAPWELLRIRSKYRVGGR